MTPHAQAGHSGRYRECRHPDCLAYRHRYAKRYRYETLHGGKRIVDAAPAVRHVQTLIGAGWSLRSIAGEASTSPSVVMHLRDGQERINRTTLARILAINPDSVPAKASKQTGEPFVPALGTRRRLRALLWMGWGWPEIREHTDLANPVAILHQKGQWVTRTTHDKVAALYDELAMKSGPSYRARTWARKLGYQPPLAWDDIDHDPEPQLDADAEPYIDEVAIQRRLSGDKSVSLSKAEKSEARKRWTAAGRSLGEFERVTGINACRDYDEQTA